MECPRWRLIEPHYLNVPVLPDGTRVEWERTETARETGRSKRTQYPVPILLDPKDAADCNYPGEIIVCNQVDGARHERGDLIFVGEPTPGMEPLNAEAEEITNRLRPRWEHPIESLAPTGEMNDRERAFMQQMMDSFSKIMGAVQPQPNQTVPKAEYDELKERLAKLEALVKQPQPESNGLRRA